jgi:hypothetical protein
MYWRMTENPEAKRCKINACDRPATSKGFCNIHYKTPEGSKKVFARRRIYALLDRRVNLQGYARIRVINQEGRSTWPLEHRYVMEQKLGRKLIDRENVHHIDGNKTNNAPENLEIWISPQPQGIRVADAIAWAKEILNRYDHPACQE